MKIEADSKGLALLLRVGRMLSKAEFEVTPREELRAKIAGGGAWKLCLVCREYVDERVWTQLKDPLDISNLSQTS